MKVIHFADIHLGYRQYQRQTPTGLNQREADIGNAFKKVISRTIEAQPDVVLVAGDLFHNVRPTNPAILQAYKQFSRLVEMLPDAIVVMVAGNHDTPRTSETGSLLGLFQSLGIHVVMDKPARLSFRDRDLSILAVPYGMRPRPEFKPDPDARYNVLLIHDVFQGLYAFRSPADSANDLTLEELDPEAWTYIALGHYHVYHKVAPNAYYSGSLEYSSSNIWGEIDEESKNPKRGKGYIEHNLETGAHDFQTIESARRVIDLPALTAEGLTAEQLGDAIRASVASCEGGIDDKIVRLVVREVPRHVLRDLDHRMVREFKRRAMHFLLDARRPQPTRTEASGAPGRRSSLTDTVRSMLERRALTPGIDRTALVELGLRYLGEADRAASARIGESE
jgi:exonuclease SbcD